MAPPSLHELVVDSVDVHGNLIIEFLHKLCRDFDPIFEALVLVDLNMPSKRPLISCMSFHDVDRDKSRFVFVIRLNLVNNVHRQAEWRSGPRAGKYDERKRRCIKETVQAGFFAL